MSVAARLGKVAWGVATISMYMSRPDEGKHLGGGAVGLTGKAGGQRVHFRNCRSSEAAWDWVCVLAAESTRAGPTCASACDACPAATSQVVTRRDRA